MIHTLQIVSPPISYTVYRRIENHVYYHVKRDMCRIIDRKENLLAFNLPLYPGVQICLNEITVPHIAMVVNPAIVLGGGYHDLCCLTPDLLGICVEYISEILQECEIKHTADQMIISRIVCTREFQLPERRAVEALLACLQHPDVPRGSPVQRFGKQYPDHKERNRHSFRMACNDVSLTIYDKSFQLLNEGLIEESEIPSGRLRFEAAFCNPSFQRLFAKYGGGVFLDDTSPTGDVRKMILRFSDLSLRILKDYFKTHISPGQYLRKDLAYARIDSSPFSEKVKFRMKKVLDEVARCHKGGISAAHRNLEREGYTQNELQYLMKCFEKIDLNLATIGVAAKYQKLPSVAELLDSEDRFIKPFSGMSM